MTELELPAATVAPAIPELGTSGANLIREAAAVMADAHKLASAVAGTEMIPKHFRGKPDECAAAMLYGASLGLAPMQSLHQIYVVHGQAALYARGMSTLVQGAGHEIWTVESTDDSVTVAGRRRSRAHIETSTWTFDRAHKAGYTNNAKYKTDPQAMLYSKALSEVCRKIAPDVLSGVYAVEELQMERWEQAPAQQHGDQLKAKLAELTESPAPPAPPATPALTDRIESAVIAFEGLNVSREQLAGFVGKPEAEWTAADLDGLVAAFQSLQAGTMTVAEMVGGDGA